MREQLLSRRSVAAGLAIAAISAPALASSDEPDRKLIALGSELETVHAGRVALNAANNFETPYTIDIGRFAKPSIGSVP